ncbi:MAG: DUF6597 domain-containing transcriptional factor [Pseudobacter sp.]|uniref:DUF6597 domain-containing transcriptional factor n=1 Tax=Pseudobacter sp. TaxID=2045420 RepID=UPI003F7E1F40
MQIKPASHIAHIVRHYLVLNGALPRAAWFRLFADGNTGLVFNTGNASLRQPGGRETQQRSWLYGQLSGYRDLDISGDLHWIIVVLQPYGAFHLWRMPATELTDRLFPAQELLGSSIDEISAALLSTPDLNNCINKLNAWISSLIDKKNAPEPLLQQAVQLINSAEGSMPVHALLKELKVNERMLERKFKQATGISPKQYSGIVRVNASAKKLQHKSGSLTAVAYDHDYFDQAHFIKDFRKYTGITPWQYQHSVDQLALNFIKF